MCTVLLAYHQVDGWPLIVANNRDEFYARRALPPRISRGTNGRRWIACHDLESGGSWWGWSSSGVLVWLTNRWTTPEYIDDGRFSRGRLVIDLLDRMETGAAAAEWLSTRHRGPGYNPFNLLLLAPDCAFLATNFPTPRILAITPGFHFLGNGELEHCPTVKARSARRLLAGLAGSNPLSGRSGRNLVLETFRRSLSTSFPQDSIPPQGFNVRFAEYGTSASLLLAIPETRKDDVLLGYCDGNPLFCNYQDFGILASLL